MTKRLAGLLAFLFVLLVSMDAAAKDPQQAPSPPPPPPPPPKKCQPGYYLAATRHGPICVPRITRP